MKERLGIQHPPWGHLPLSLVQPRVQALWKRYPDWTVKQVIAHLGVECPVSLTRALRLWRECRLAATRRSVIQKKLHRPLDRRTAVRLRIHALWKRHPEYTAKQVIRTLAPLQPVRVGWVQKILRDCWRAAYRPTPVASDAGSMVAGIRAIAILIDM
jgi:hypothetical protein